MQPALIPGSMLRKPYFPPHAAALGATAPMLPPPSLAALQASLMMAHHHRILLDQQRQQQQVRLVEAPHYLQLSQQVSRSIGSAGSSVSTSPTSSSGKSRVGECCCQESSHS